MFDILKPWHSNMIINLQPPDPEVAKNVLERFLKQN